MKRNLKNTKRCGERSEAAFLHQAASSASASPSPGETPNATTSFWTTDATASRPVYCLGI